MSTLRARPRAAAAAAMLAIAIPGCKDGIATHGATTGNGEPSGATSSGSGPVAPGYTIALEETSTSGLSAGGFMAVQFHVAYSSIMKGAAVFAGGPYDCAQGSLTQAEIGCQFPFMPPPIGPFVAATQRNAAAGEIDDPSHLAGQRAFLFGGAVDYTVNPVTMDALASYYGAFLDPSAIHYENRHAGAGHTMPTVAYGGPCATTASPWIGACNYDGAGEALAWIYGTLNPPATSLSGRFLTLNQADFVNDPASHSLSDTGYAYVPAACEQGATCRVHVSFHGCKQYATGEVGDAYYKHAGYDEWADTNRIIVIYPQAAPGTGGELNPNGCFDWWGYDSASYTTKAGPQMAMARAMIRYFAGR